MALALGGLGSTQSQAGFCVRLANITVWACEFSQKVVLIMYLNTN